MALVTALVAAAALTAGACGARGSDGPSAERTALRFQVSGDREETGAFQALATAYEKRTRRQVDVVVVENEIDHATKIATSSAGGDPPDVFVLGYRTYSALAGRGALRAAGPLLEDRGVELATIEKAPAEAFTQNGTLVCLPLNASSMVVYWNRTVFAAAGAKPPAPGWTWEDFRKAALSTTGGGVRGLGASPRLIRIAPFVWSLGGEIVDDPTTPTTTTFATPQGTAAVTLFADLLRAEAMPSAAETAAEALDTQFSRGRLAMLLSSRRDVPRFREVSDLDWDVAPVPTSPTGRPVSILHSDGACLSARGKRLAAAADFIAYLASDEAQSLAALSGRFVPVTHGARPAFLDPARPPPSGHVFLDQLASVRRVPTVARWSAAEDRVDEVLEELWLDPDRDVQQVAERMDEAARRALRG